MAPRSQSKWSGSLLLEWIWWGGLPALLGAACYSNGLRGDLVHDDVFAIKENRDVLPTSPLLQLFLDNFWGESMSSVTSHKSYRPLTVLTFRLNYLLHGLEPLGYHLANVCLHVLVTLMFGGLCRGVFFRGGLRNGVMGADYSSCMAMMLFAVHPVHTEAVSCCLDR